MGVISLAMLLSQGWSDPSQTSFLHRIGMRGWGKSWTLLALEALVVVPITGTK